jgi:hypothetical protein
MTVIACRDNIIAADTATWDGDIKIGLVQKIVRLPDGSLLAACGKASLIWGYIEWLKDDGVEKPTDGASEEDFGALNLRCDGVFSIDHHYQAMRVDADFYALGAHGEFLYGAMAAGASAEEAVRLALKYCGFAGGEVQVERLEQTVTVHSWDENGPHPHTYAVTGGGEGFTLGGSLDGKVGD